MKAGLEAKVGIFVIVCFVLIGFMSFKTGSSLFGGPKGTEIRAEVSNASGLTPDSAVVFNGVEVGKVKDVSLIGGKPVITLVIDSKYEIPSNVIFSVRSNGVMGEKFAELKMKGDAVAGILKSGDVITESVTSTDLDQLGNQFGDIAVDVKAITEALREVLATVEAKDNMKVTLENARVSTDILREILIQNEKRVDAIMKNTEALTAALNDITQHNQQNINDIIANIKGISGNVDDIVGDNKEDINESIKSLRTVMAKIETTMDNMDNITGQIKSGEGTVGKLIYDNQTIDNLNETLTGLKGTLGKLDKLQVYLTFAGEKQTRNGDSNGYFNLKIVPNEKRYYLLGVETHPDGRDTTKKVKRTYTKPGYGEHSQDYAYTETVNKDDLSFTAQYAHRFFDRLYFRVGLKESEAGVGLDYFPLKNNQNLELKLDVFDFPDKDEDRNVNVKALARYKFFENFFVSGGVNEIANKDRRTFFFGGGVEFRDDDLKYLFGSVPKSF